MNQQLARIEQLKPAMLSINRQVESLLMDKNKAKRFLAAALTVASNKSLINCNPDSLAQAAVGVAMNDLNIDPNFGHCYIVPYQGEAQLQIGFKGYIQLLFRAGWLVKAYSVYHCDKFYMEFDGWDNQIRFTPNLDERQEGDNAWVFENLRGVYAVARHSETKEEFSTFVPKSIIEKLRLNSPNQKLGKYTKPHDAKALSEGKPIGIWDGWYEEMAKAKAIKRLAKTLPISDMRVQTAIISDDKAEMGQRVDYKEIASGTIIEPLEPVIEATEVEPDEEVIIWPLETEDKTDE